MYVKRLLAIIISLSLILTAMPADLIAQLFLTPPGIRAYDEGNQTSIKYAPVVIEHQKRNTAQEFEIPRTTTHKFSKYANKAMLSVFILYVM